MPHYLDAWGVFVLGAYAVFLLACTAGAFSRLYQANLAQRLALAMFAVWSAWRMGLVWSYGWGYPHEPLVAAAMALYALGSVFKTVQWRVRAKKGRRRYGDV